MRTKQLPRQPPRRRLLQQEQGFDIVQAMNTLFRRWFEGDECAFWADERTALSDVETYRAVLPSLMTLPGAMLVGISTPTKSPDCCSSATRRLQYPPRCCSVVRI